MNPVTIRLEGKPLVIVSEVEFRRLLDLARADWPKELAIGPDDYCGRG